MKNILSALAGRVKGFIQSFGSFFTKVRVLGKSASFLGLTNTEDRQVSHF